MGIVSELLLEAQYTSQEAAIFAPALGAWGEEHQWQKALDLWMNDIISLTRPALPAANEIVGACAKAGQGRRAMHLLREMPSLQVEPNMITFSAVLNVTESSGEYAQMLEIMEPITQLGFGLIRLRQGQWRFQHIHTNYPGHVVMILDELHWHNCLPRLLELAYHRCMYGSIFTRLLYVHETTCINQVSRPINTSSA